MDIKQRNELIQRWQNALHALDEAKEAELALRNQLVETQFDDEKTEGTQNIELANGWKLQCVKKKNYRLDKSKTESALEKIENLGDEERFIADRLVKYEPKLSLSEYKTLPSKVKKLIDTAVTASPGTPSLKLVEPKAKK